MFPILKMVESWKRRKNDSAKIILTRFLHFEITLDEVIKAFSGRIVVDFRPNRATRYIGDNRLSGKVSVEFKRSDLIFAVRKLLDGQITLGVLSDWAAFIYMSDLFILDVEEQTDIDPGDSPVWDVLQRMTVPSIFGLTDRASFEKLLIELGE